MDRIHKINTIKSQALALFKIFTVASLAVAALASAQQYPLRPVTLVVPLAAGSTMDIITRVIGAELSKSLGQQMIVDNRPGAGGAIGMGQVAKSRPDGYTLGMSSNASLAINVGLYSKLPYDSVKDFAPVYMLATSSNVLIVNPANPARNVGDLIAQAKAKPGGLTFSSGGNGTTHHLSGALLNMMGQVDTVHVPYKGAPQGITALMAGEVTYGFFNTPNVVGLIKEKRVKGLAVTSAQRSPLLPEIPTMTESGVKGYEVTVSYGVVAPASTPDAIVTRLASELGKIVAKPDVRTTLTPQGFDVITDSGPAAYRKQIKADIEKWVPIVKASGASVD